MSVWDNYQERIESKGATKRGAALHREAKWINMRLSDSLSYFEATVDGIKREVAIINSDNLNEKKMISLPGEDFDCGGLVEWADNHWLITEKDANNELYTRVKLLQCNYLLKWVDSNNIIHEQWCVIEDGTKYLTGEYEDRNFIVTRGDSRISMTISKNEFTAKFGREQRFLIDDRDSDGMIAYALTKPLKVGRTYNGKGIYAFVLQEVVTTDDDNIELGIADYYKHFPKVTSVDMNNGTTINPDDNVDEQGRSVWL